MANVEIYIDGAVKNNPGEGGIGIIIKKDGEILFKISKYIGNVTNNEAEYKALIEALKFANLKGFREAKIYSDSELLVKQVNDEYKIKDDKLGIYYKEVKNLINNFDRVIIEYIKREKNREADILANNAILLK